MKHHLIKLLLILLSFNTFASEPLETNDIKWRLNLGLIGGTYGEEIHGRGHITELTVKHQNDLYTIRHTHYDNRSSIPIQYFECVFNIFDCEDDQLTNSIDEYALLYGKSFDNGAYSFSAGISKLTGKDHINGLEEFSVYGFPMEFYWRIAQLKNIGFENINLGLTSIANINKEQSFIGIYFSLSIGSY